MVCKNCGAFCADNATFCEKCGSQLVNEAPYQAANNVQQVNNGQQYYQQPLYTPQVQTEEPVSVKEWLLTTLVMIIPLVNIIMVFVWAFGNGAKKSKSNFFKAYLVWILIFVVISIIVAILTAALGIGLGSMYF